MIEGWSFLTDIIKAEDGTEIRRRCRLIARRTLAMRVVAMSEREATLLSSFLEEYLGERWRVPYWPDARRVTAGLAGTSLTVDKAWRGTVTTVPALAIATPLDFETKIVTATSTTAVTINSAITLVGRPVWLAPLREAYLDPTYDVKMTRPSRDTLEAELRFIFI
jgi:hypothetical protein